MTYAFTTTGTTDFLKKLVMPYHDQSFTFMKNRQTTAVYYESEKKKSIFRAGTRFTVLQQYMNIPEKGFVVIQTIPVARESRKLFLEKMDRHFHSFTLTTGLEAARVLEARKKDSFQLLMVWEKEAYYEEWKDKEGHETDFAQLVRKPTYFVERAYTQTYFILEEEI